MKARRIFAENLKSFIVRHQLYIEIKHKIEKSPARFHPGRAASFCSGFDLHPAGQGEGDPVLGVDRHAVYQRGPLACVEFGVELRQDLDGFDQRQLNRVSIFGAFPLRAFMIQSFWLTGIYGDVVQCILLIRQLNNRKSLAET